MGRRRLARETALQALYLADVSSVEAPAALEIVLAGNGSDGLDAASVTFLGRLVEGAWEHRREIDEKLQAAADNWELKRMAAVDRSLLRLAAYELLHDPETPPAVVIDEALEIAKKYSGEDSTRFINGLLDRIKTLRG